MFFHIILFFNNSNCVISIAKSAFKECNNLNGFIPTIEEETFYECIVLNQLAIF